MVDVVTQQKRSQMMSGIKGKGTQPEREIGRILHACGLRYRLHRTDLPGKPDLVFPRHKAVVLVHGCFWHGHNCHLFKMPQTRTHFWRDKIQRNRVRDRSQLDQLIDRSWRVMIVWECALKGRERLPRSELASEMADWIRAGNEFAEIQGPRKR